MADKNRNHKLQTIFTILLSLIFSLSSGLYAQGKMSGVVYDQNGEPLDGAVISVLETDSISFINYTIADAQGKWSMNVPSEPKFVIEFSMFGYGSKYDLITDPTQYKEPFSVQLIEEAFNLQEVTIKDRGIGVSQRGDTLNFNLGYFTTGAERTLGDVINRLPGLEIIDGSVYYGGKIITKMLVQGKDIINNNHKLATEGIRADQLGNIQIIENFKEKEDQFETQQSEQVAMDVQLKEDFLNKWSGDVEVLGGLPSSLKGNVNAFNLGSKVGISTFVRANNVGEEVLGWRDVQGMMDNRRRGPGFMFITSGPGNALMPPGLNISEQVQANRDGIINLNIDYQPNDDLQIKGFAIAAYAERNSDVFRRTEYITENIIRSENSKTYSESPIGSMVWKMDYQINSKTFMNVYLPFSINKGFTDYNNVGQYGIKDFKTEKTIDALNYDFLPSMTLRRKVGEKGQWTTNLNYGYTKGTGANYYRDDFAFLGVPISGDSLYTILQERTEYNQDFTASSTLKLVKGDWYVEPAAGYTYRDDKLIFDADKTGIFDFGKKAEMIQNAAFGRLRGGYETNDWEVSPEVSVNYLNRNLYDAGKHDEIFPGYGLTVVKKFDASHTLRLSGDYGLSYPSFNQVRQTYEISSATQINTGGIAPDIAQKAYSVNLSYNNFMPLKSAFYFTSLNYSYSDDVITSLTERYEDFMLSGVTLVPYRQNFSWNGMIGGELRPLPVRVRTSLNYMWSENYSVGLGQQFLVENNNYSAGLNASSTWKFPLNVSAGIRYNYNISNPEIGPKRDFSSLVPSVSLDYTYEGFKVGTRFRYDVGRGDNESTNLYLWNMDASYELNNIPLRFSIVANNILNMAAKEKLVSSFGSDTNTYTRYMIFPGYIIAGVSWSF